MRKQGRIVRWETERGFGFIRSDHAGDSQEAFLHIRELRHVARPEVGLRVEYDEIHMGGRGPRAVAVVARDPAHQPLASVRPAPHAVHRAQLLLRHKCTKPSFREVFWATVILHYAALGAVLWFGRSDGQWWGSAPSG